MRHFLPFVLGLALVAPAHAESDFDAEIRLLQGALRIAPGDVIADIGAGQGEYAIALAPRVGPEGRVFATELDAGDRAAIEDAARESGASQVDVRPAETDGTGLPAASCDGAYLRGVYHHLTEPDAFAEDLFATIEPGGRLVVIDFPPSFWLAWWTPEGIPEDRGGHGIRPELVIRELEAAGFVHARTIDRWPSYGFVTKDYALVFERP